MSAPPMVSEREAVLRERAAFVKGRNSPWTVARVEAGPNNTVLAQVEPAEKIAAREYPLPQKERPRVVTYDIGGTKVAFRVIEGLLESQVVLAGCCPHEVRWERLYGVTVRQLIGNSVEYVDDDGASE